MTAERREIESNSALAPTLSVTNKERDGVPAQEELQPGPFQLRMHRISVGAIFFMHGLCFASWASRIPTLQENLNLTAAALGTVLFALPVGFFISLPFAGWFVGKVGSKKVVVLSAVLYGLSLVGIGTTSNAVQLFFCLFSFGFFANLLNISINTQAIAVERLYKKLSLIHI